MSDPMKKICALIFVFGLAAFGFSAQSASSGEGSKSGGEQRTPAETIGKLAGSARQELDKSVKELNQLRDQIAAEKLPLAQDLTATEEQLTKLRTEYENVTRLVDSGNLELTTIKAEMKARQDEMGYIANLLDEYARSFESKINICELQYTSATLEAAKQVTESTTLSKSEKYARQLDFVTLSVKRLGDAIGGMRFPGIAVDMGGTVVEGQYAIVGPVALFGANNGGVAGLVIPQTGSNRPMVRPLEGPMQAGLAALVTTGEGLLPLDPSRGGALKQLVQKTDLVQIFKKGGPIMWPLLVAAGLSILTVLERILFLMNEARKRSPKALERFFEAIGKGKTEEAITISNNTKFHVVRALGYALAHKERSISNALLYAQEKEMKRFRRGIPILDTVITLAPLLGLLGTVTGMMGSFSLIGGDLSAPGAITGGIAEALIATAFGLGIAITSLIPFNYLNTKMDEARIEIETASTQLELLVHPTEITEAGIEDGELIPS